MLKMTVWNKRNTHITPLPKAIPNQFLMRICILNGPAHLFFALGLLCYCVGGSPFWKSPMPDVHWRICLFVLQCCFEASERVSVRMVSCNLGTGGSCETNRSTAKVWGAERGSPGAEDWPTRCLSQEYTLPVFALVIPCYCCRERWRTLQEQSATLNSENCSSQCAGRPFSAYAKKNFVHKIVRNPGSVNGKHRGLEHSSQSTRSFRSM